jgi:acetyl esterase/lipase
MSANECINRREFLKGMTVSSMGLTIGAQALTAITLTSSEPAIAGDAADERGKDAANGYRLLHNVQYGVVDNTPLLMNITIPDPKPKKPVPAILFLHGGGWGGGSREDMMSHCYFVSKAGYVGASVEYRLVNQAPFPAQLQDCKGAVRFIRANAKKYGINPDLIGVWGCSAGGHLAAMIGLT